MLRGGVEESGMPQAKNDARGKKCLPVVVRRYNLVHKREKSIGVVVDLHVDIEHDMSIFLLESFTV